MIAVTSPGFVLFAALLAGLFASNAPCTENFCNLPSLSLRLTFCVL